MKKIITIFMITFCLLSFVGISCLAAKEATSPSGMWNSMDDNNKEVYIWGIREGLFLCVEQITERYLVPSLTNKYDTSIIEDVLENYYQFVTIFKADDFKTTDALFKTVVNIINDLYKDPANTYIEVFDMCFLASRKLRGESIESSLRELREKALP